MAELPNSVPALSQAALDQHRAFLADMRRAEAQPGGIPALPGPMQEYYQKMQDSIRSAERVTGQQLNPVSTDTRSPAAAFYDRSHALGMMDAVRQNIQADLAAATPPDMTATARAIEAVGQDYLEQISLARIAFQHAGIKGDPERLGPVALRQAAETGRHIRRELPGRPS
jgi:hypothetical protein